MELKERASLKNIVEKLDDELVRKGKTLQIEYNHQTDDFKVLIADMHRMK